MARKNADTSMLSNEEIAKHDLYGSKRPPGKSPGGVLHQQGGGMAQAGKYPVLLAGVFVIAGLGAWTYYRSTHPDPDGQARAHSPIVQNAQESANKAKATQS